MMAEIGTGRFVYARQLGTTIDAGQCRDTQSLNSHPPVGVGRVVLHSRQRGHILAAWREMADRVGRAGVTGERERLAAAAPPKSNTRPAQLAHGTCIQAVPWKALEAGEFAQMSASECSRTDQNSRPGIDSAAWQGSTLPAGVTLGERRPPTHGFANRA
jgi:hypothetical protein